MEFFLTRYPIFDPKRNLYAYELNFSKDLFQLQQQNASADRTSSKIITESLFMIGLDKLVTGKRAFIPFSRNLLLNKFAELLPKDLVGIQISREMGTDHKVIQACRDLKSKGFMIILDGFSFQPDYTHMVEFADVVKVDIIKIGEYIRKTVLKRLKPRGIKCIMKNVNTNKNFITSVAMGYDFMQGDFFQQTAVISSREVSTTSFAHFEMLKEIHKSELDLNVLENIIKRDVALSFKLLRMINSAAFGLKNEIKSIRQALVILGNIEIKKWFSLILLSNLNENKPSELMRTSLLRAKLMELMSPFLNLKDQASDLFLTGIFSLIDVLMDEPLSDILDGLPLDDEIKNTLLKKESRYSGIYKLVLDYEKGDWDSLSEKTKQLKINEEKLSQIYNTAIQWVDKISKS